MTEPSVSAEIPTRRPRVLILIDHYLPGYKYGGPIRTIANLVHSLGHEFQFLIVTRDRDLQDTDPYPGIVAGEWQDVGNARVCYLPPESVNPLGMRRIINATDYDVLYLNSLFSRMFALTPVCLRRLSLIAPKPTILAPRGMLSPGALELKRTKKRVFLFVANAVNLFRGMIWQATSTLESSHIEQWFRARHEPASGRDQIVLASNLSPAIMRDIEGSKCVPKSKGELRIVYLSRITEKKNLEFALRILADLKTSVVFDIYGPIDRDREYWNRCNNLLESLPRRIKARYVGPVEPEKVRETFSKYHVFFFPTKGENFGHVILEAMLAGCPVLISDQTPWKDLTSKKAGWAIPLDKPQQFRDALDFLIELSDEEFGRYSRCAKKYALETTSDLELLDQNRQLFLNAISAPTAAQLCETRKDRTDSDR